MAIATITMMDLRLNMEASSKKRFKKIINERHSKRVPVRRLRVSVDSPIIKSPSPLREPPKSRASSAAYFGEFVAFIAVVAKFKPSALNAIHPVIVNGSTGVLT